MLRLPDPAPGQRLRATGLHGASDALALALAAREDRPLVLLTASAADAQRLVQEIAFFDAGRKVHLLPDWETLPYDSFSPHQDLVSERISTLYQVTHDDCHVLVVPVTTALLRLPPPRYLAAYSFFLKKGEALPVERLREQLTLAGYSYVSQVLSPGEASVRGGLIDLFPMGSTVPYRIELLDDQIDSIRAFDPDTQRSIYKVGEVRLLPAREFPTDEAARGLFRRQFRERFEGDASRSPLYRDVSQGLFPAGVEYYLPLFFEQTATLFDYLPAATRASLVGDVSAAAEAFWAETHSRYLLLRGDALRPLLPPAEIFLTVEEFFTGLKPLARLDILAPGAAAPDCAHCDTAPLPPLQVDRRAEDPLHRLRAFLGQFAGRVLLCAESLGRRETLSEYLRNHDLAPVPCEGYAAFLEAQPPLMLCAGALGSGFLAPGDGLAIITENELYAGQVRTRDRRGSSDRSTVENMLRDLSEVKVGDPVVHATHGVGRYLGLTNMDLGEGSMEFLALEYASGDKLYVPVSQLQVIGRYSGAQPETAPLHRLGSGQWEKARRKAAQQVRDTAAELLNVYAARAARQGYAFSLKPQDYEAFCDGFPFEETRDQQEAIDAVLKDMTSGRPMDRLICGDVGFGKTEVALRGAFVAVMDGKQVAVLVPTTLLAEQHFQTFSDRFADWPVRIAELSRFRSAKEQNASLALVAEGKVDIVIGTHKLVQDRVRFANLGLVIIDEEHRFGVRHKERLKALRAEVDVLTLTATPIPRTLALSLEGLREFSVIATAPQRRLSIKTFVSRDSPGLIREAVLRELKRGGQVYFVHNEIETIARQEAALAALVPEARIRVAHGQMPERELELAMRDFYQQRFSVLLCTTIIETGIDVASANTIIINRADRFGLAQLHQLRGRVGRSHHQAYAYLLTPEEGALSAQAKKRLEAIQMMEELGSGFFLAMHDLEIRGAGEVLGESQSGEMQEIGFALYSEMLESAIKSLKAGKEPDLTAPLGVTTEINLHAPALLPDTYCADVHERLVVYKRLANCDTQEALDALREELTDRFGLPPEPTLVLFDTHRLRLLARALGVVKIDAGPDSLQLQFMPNPPVDHARIIALLQSGRDYRMNGPDRLRLQVAIPESRARVKRLTDIFRELT